MTDKDIEFYKKFGILEEVDELVYDDVFDGLTKTSKWAQGYIDFLTKRVFYKDLHKNSIIEDPIVYEYSVNNIDYARAVSKVINFHEEEKIK